MKYGYIYMLMLGDSCSDANWSRNNIHTKKLTKY